MKKILVSAIVATVVTLGVYLGADFFGMQRGDAIFVAFFISLAATFMVVVFGATTLMASFVFAFTSTLFAGALVSTIPPFVVVIAIFAIFVLPFVGTMVAEAQGIKFWKAGIVYLLEAVAIVITIYPHSNW